MSCKKKGWQICLLGFTLMNGLSFNGSINSTFHYYSDKNSTEKNMKTNQPLTLDLLKTCLLSIVLWLMIEK